RSRSHRCLSTLFQRPVLDRVGPFSIETVFGSQWRMLESSAASILVSCGQSRQMREMSSEWSESISCTESFTRSATSNQYQLSLIHPHLIVGPRQRHPSSLATILLSRNSK